VTKRYPATDVTLSPSLAEILLELEDSYLIIILQARHRENSLLRAFFYLESDKRAAHRKPSGRKPVPKPLYTGTATVVHDHFNYSLLPEDTAVDAFFWLHCWPKPSASSYFHGYDRLSSRRRSRGFRWVFT